MRAIKMYREETGSGWAAAAEAVERIQSGGAPGSAAQPNARKPAARLQGAAPEIRVVERAKFGPTAILLLLAALSGAVFGIAYLLAARS